MSLWRSFWDDETGAIVSAELAAVGAVAVVGGTAGLNMAGTAINAEMKEMAYSVRSLNQSYAVVGQTSCGAWTAGSCYTQPPVEQSISELNAIIDGQPKVQQGAPKKPQKGKKNKAKQKVNVEDEAAFLEADQSALGPIDPVEAADDASQMEVVIEPAPDA